MYEYNRGELRRSCWRNYRDLFLGVEASGQGHDGLAERWGLVPAVGKLSGGTWWASWQIADP